MRHSIKGAGALATLACALLAAPSAALAVTVSTSYASLDEMPPGIRALFIGTFVTIGLVVAIAVVISLRKGKSDAALAEDALAEVREIVEAAGVQAGQGGPTVLIGGVPVMVGGQPVGATAPSAPTGDMFAEIKATDPAFNEERFKGHVNEVFLTVKYAWAARDMEPVRRFMSDEQSSAANVKLQAEYVARGRINNLENLFVTGISPVEVSRQGEFDSVTVIVEGTVIASTVDERTGRLVNPAVMGDGKTQRRFREAWTFLRKVGVQSKEDATIQQCPNCGAPVTESGYVRCAYCGVEMNDPTLDWVVMHIEHLG